MRILGGFIMKVNFFLWLHPDVYLWSRFYQHQGTLDEGSWVNVNLLDNPSWLSNPRYSTIPPYIVLAFCLVLDSSVGFLVPFLTPKQGISKYGMSWEARVTWFPRFLAVFQFPYPWEWNLVVPDTWGPWHNSVMSMKSKIFDSFLLFVSFNFFTLKLGIWKQKLAFSVQHPRMIPKRWCLLWTRHLHPVSKVRPQSGLHLLQRTRVYGTPCGSPWLIWG